MFQVSPNPDIEVAMVSQALRNQASVVPLEFSTSVLCTVDRTWLQGELVNKEDSCSITCLLEQIGPS